MQTVNPLKDNRHTFMSCFCFFYATMGHTLLFLQWCDKPISIFEKTQERLLKQQRLSFLFHHLFTPLAHKVGVRFKISLTRGANFVQRIDRTIARNTDPCWDIKTHNKIYLKTSAMTLVDCLFEKSTQIQ